MTCRVSSLLVVALIALLGFAACLAAAAPTTTITTTTPLPTNTTTAAPGGDDDGDSNDDPWQRTPSYRGALTAIATICGVVILMMLVLVASKVYLEGCTGGAPTKARQFKGSDASPSFASPLVVGSEGGKSAGVGVEICSAGPSMM